MVASSDAAPYPALSAAFSDTSSFGYEGTERPVKNGPVNS